MAAISLANRRIVTTRAIDCHASGLLGLFVFETLDFLLSKHRLTTYTGRLLLDIVSSSQLSNVHLYFDQRTLEVDHEHAHVKNFSTTYFSIQSKRDFSYV